MSNELQIFENAEFGKVRTVLLAGKPYAVGIDVARALGYAKPSQAIIDHCKGIRKSGIPSKGGIQETNVIPEGDIYRLIVKSNLPSAERFESWVFDEVLPQIRKTGSYGKPMSQVEILAQAAQQLVEQEKRLNAVEKRMDGIHDVLALSPNGWRKDSANLINRIAATLGGPEHIQPIRAESYKFLNERMHVDLAARLRNMKRKAADEGVCKTKRERFNYLDVIGQDPKLIEGYTIIIKDMAIRYGVADEM